MTIGNKDSSGAQGRKSPTLVNRIIGRRGQVQESLPIEGQTPGTDCIFCQWSDPSLNNILCENSAFYVRFDNFPANPGHVEIVPKRHVESYFDLTEEEVTYAHRALHEAKRLLDERYFPEAYTIGINDGKAAGQTIGHLHIHLIPRRHGDVDDPRGGIRKAAPNCDPDKWQ